MAINRLKKAWEFVSHADTAFSVIGAIPWKSLAALVASLIPAGLAWRLSNLPPWAIALIALAGLCLVAWLLVAILALSDRRKNRAGMVSGRHEYDQGTAHRLEVVFDTSGKYRRTRHQWTFIRFGIRNAGSVVAENVEVYLDEMIPAPSSGMFHPDFPYRVRRSNTPETGNRSINAGDEEQFDVLWFWVASNELGLMVDGIDTKRLPSSAHPDHYGYEAGRVAFPMGQDEHWHMYYRVTSANAKGLTFVLFAERENNEVRVSLIK